MGWRPVVGNGLGRRAGPFAPGTGERQVLGNRFGRGSEEPWGLGNMFGHTRTMLGDPGLSSFDDQGRQVFGNGFARRAGLHEAGEELRKRAVWGRGKQISGRNSDEWRKDDFGNLLQFSAYGDTRSPYGWQIDHIVPVARGGTDDILNLRPLHWRKNASLGGLLSQALLAGRNP